MSRSGRWLTRPVVAWAMYDVASSAYVALVPPLFGIYFVSVVQGDAPGASARWGTTAALALVIAGVTSPLVGAIVDRGGGAIRLLAAMTALCAIATAAMPTAGAGELFRAAGLFVAAQVGYTLATALYDSLVVRVARPEHLGRVSGFGWALGFVGGGLALIGALAIVRGLPLEAQLRKLGDVFMLGGIVFGALSVPALLWMRGVKTQQHGGPVRRPTVREAYSTVLGTLLRWREHREVFRFVLASYLIIDVLTTILLFAGIVMRARFGLSVETLIGLVLLYHFVALPATLVSGHLADLWGQRPTLYTMLLILSAALVLLALGAGSTTPLLVIVLLGLVYGSLQAVSRSLFARLVPPGKAAELFGFNALAGRLSAASGPLLFGLVAAATGSESTALLVLLTLLAAAAAILAKLRIPAAHFKAGDATALRDDAQGGQVR